MAKGLPYYTPLAPEEVEQIDQTGRQILERIGIRVRDSSFIELLKKFSTP